MSRTIPSNTISASTLPSEVLAHKFGGNSVFVPKTARGRRIMELRRLAEAAGEEFLPSSVLLEQLRKNRA